MNEKNLIKLASFYVSDWHLTTMLVPYVNRNLTEGTQIINILEEDLVKNIETLIEKLNFKDKEKILDLNWKKIKPLNKEKIEKIVDDNIGKANVSFIVVGTEKYIENANNLIYKTIENCETNNKIKVINCFNVTRLKGKINGVLGNYDKLLNTSGEREIQEIY